MCSREGHQALLHSNGTETIECAQSAAKVMRVWLRLGQKETQSKGSNPSMAKPGSGGVGHLRLSSAGTADTG